MGDHAAAPAHMLLDCAAEATSAWPIQEALALGSFVAVTDLATKFDALPGIVFDSLLSCISLCSVFSLLKTTSGGQWHEPPLTAIVVPLYTHTGTEKDFVGVLIAGINPRRPFDGDYKGFVELVTAHVSSVLSFARVYPLLLYSLSPH